MTLKLSKDLSDALHANGSNGLEVVDPDSNRIYFVVDADIHRQAMEALRRQQDREAIALGIAEMEAGEGTSVDEAFEGIRANLSLPQRKQ
ncbi:hypothetical protein Poly24_55350 [Rosistilla carotiformis]|uniref:Uncharacterized protein n=1 Tax=Rosistilla carotiformis TaxID=2528017 RepID=A0A518K211_9BACT|nr:hypothetical protein [Rosistilla carotiformis]QDV71795.1 hypothetical protein Poly24_55350 [Rosistilla carotiformis]